MNFVQVVYTCASGFSSQVTTQVPVNVIFPFVPAFDFFSKEFHAITPNDLSQTDEFMLLVAVKALTDFPLEVLGVDLMIVSNIYTILQDYRWSSSWKGAFVPDL